MRLYDVDIPKKIIELLVNSGDPDYAASDLSALFASYLFRGSPVFNGLTYGSECCINWLFIKDDMKRVARAMEREQ